MKKGYYIIIIIFLGLLVLTNVLSIFINEDDRSFILPDSDDEISLYDESSFVIRDTYVSYIATNGYVQAYQYENILIENLSVEDFEYQIGDYIYEGDELLFTNNLEGNHRIIDISYNTTQDLLSVRLLDLNLLRLVFFINQDNVENIFIGQNISYMLNGNEYSAEISEIEPEIINGQVKVYGSILEKPSIIYNGSFVNITIITRQKEDVILVNKNAVYYVNETPYVDLITYSNNQEILTRVEIVLGLENPIYYEILSGLQEGQRVVVYRSKDVVDEFR